MKYFSAFSISYCRGSLIIYGLKATKDILKSGYSLLFRAPSWFQEALKLTLTLLASRLPLPISSTIYKHRYMNSLFVGAKDRALLCGDNQGLCGGVAGIFEGSLRRSSISTSVQMPATRA
jgi:hypothetical protein